MGRSDTAYLEIIYALVLGFRAHTSSLPLKNWMRIFLRDNFMNDGSPRNLCVQNLLGSTAEKAYWRGDLLVVKMAAEGQQGYTDGRLMDVSLEEDIEPLKRWLEWYGR